MATTDYAGFAAVSKVLGWIDGTMPIHLDALARVLDQQVRDLSEEQLELLRRFLNRSPAFCRSRAERQSILSQSLGLLASEGGWTRLFPVDLLDDVPARCRSNAPFTLPIRAAYGLIQKHQQDCFRTAVVDGKLTRRDLLECAYDGMELSRRLASHCGSARVSFQTADLSGMPMTPLPAHSWYGEPLEIMTNDGHRFEMLIANETELDQVLWLEESTTQWLDDTLETSSVLYDVGANIGLYSLYAQACRPGCRVVSFEPAAMNVHRLLLNLQHNEFPAEWVFPIPLSNRQGPSTFGYLSLMPGTCSHLGAHASGARPGSVVAGAFTSTIDALVAQMPTLAMPTHLKLDVDGHEPQIIEGAAETLKQPNLLHLAIESTAAAVPDLCRSLEPYGFELSAPPPKIFGNAFFKKEQS